MKTVQLAYGKTGFNMSVPDDAQVIEPRHLAGLADEFGAVVAALRSPIGTPQLYEYGPDHKLIRTVGEDVIVPLPEPVFSAPRLLVVASDGAS